MRRWLGSLGMGALVQFDGLNWSVDSPFSSTDVVHYLVLDLQEHVSSQLGPKKSR